MDIQMVGINYVDAGIDIRERFSYTKREQTEALQRLKETEGISGCILLSTCNRTELWISYEDGWTQDLRQLFCELRGVELQEYETYIHILSGMQAVEYLFYLSGGLKSQILGEDQILTQIKEASTLSREYFCTDKILETLFRMAVTAGKAVKTEISFPMGNHSAPLAAIAQLERGGAVFRDQECLVIGNGAMGRLTAQLLLERGARVTVTIRQYRSGIVDVPFEAHRIDYSGRYEKIPDCSYVFSATASPNVTIRKNALQRISLRERVIFVDLAVPRDIEKDVGELQGVRLYDIDDFQIDTVSAEGKELLRQADVLLQERIRDFVCWYEAKDVVPVLMQVSRSAAEDVLARVDRTIRKAAPEQRQQLEETVGAAVQKVVNKLLFSVRDSVDVNTFRECVDVMQELYRKDS